MVIMRTPTDIFPNIDIPVVAWCGSMRGSRRNRCRTASSTISERALTTTVNDIEHIESQSLNGIGVIKIFFQPKANMRWQSRRSPPFGRRQLRQLPPGTTPPLIIQYNASSVPILQLGLSGKVCRNSS